MSSKSSKFDSSNKRKSDNDHQNAKKLKAGEVIELSDDSDELKIVDELKSTQIENKSESKEKIEDQISDQSTESNQSSNKNPTNFYLTKVLNGIDESFNNEFTLTIKEILSKKFGKLKQR